MSKKASNIAELSRHGIRVPTGFQLDPSHYREAIEPVRDAVSRAAREVVAVQRIFAGVRLPARTIRALSDGLKAISADSQLAVRSSGNVVAKGLPIAEDGCDHSLAGQFESFLNVPRDQLDAAVRLCWASLFNERSIKSFEIDEEYVDKSAMTVLVQEMVPAAASAVVMTVDPLGDGATGAIELAIGPCEAIVGGAVTPDEVIFERESGLIVQRRVGAKEFEIDYEPFTGRAGNAIRRVLPDSRRGQLAVTESVLSELIDLARDIEYIFGVPQDIEAVVDATGTITVVQARPITRLPTETTAFKRRIPNRSMLT